MIRIILFFFVSSLRLMPFFIFSFQLCFDAASSLPPTVHAHNLLHRKNRKNPDHKKSLGEATLTYEQKFTVNRHTTRLPERCHRTLHQKTNVICKAYIHLIRPDNIIREWQHQQATNKKIILKMEDMGLDAVQARLETERHLSFNTLPAGTVTGTFERFSRQVYRYRFRDETTGQTDTLLVTPEHRFYSATRKAYAPLSTLGTNDRLITANGHYAKLVCPKGRHEHCGKALTGHPLRLVYNLEVAVDHVYFAGHQHMLVHNGYYHYCSDCKVSRRTLIDFNEKHRRMHRIRRVYTCDNCLYSSQSKQFFDAHGRLMHTPVWDHEANRLFESKGEQNQYYNIFRGNSYVRCRYCDIHLRRYSYAQHLELHSVPVFELSPDRMFMDEQPFAINTEIINPPKNSPDAVPSLNGNASKNLPDIVKMTYPPDSEVIGMHSDFDREVADLLDFLSEH